MRAVEYSCENGIIYLDRSPGGVRRYVVETKTSTSIYSSLYYKLDQIKAYLNNEQNGN